MYAQYWDCMGSRMSMLATQSWLAPKPTWYGVGCSYISTVTSKGEKSHHIQFAFTFPKVTGFLPFYRFNGVIEQAEGRGEEKAGAWSDDGSSHGLIQKHVSCVFLASGGVLMIGTCTL